MVNLIVNKIIKGMVGRFTGEKSGHNAELTASVHCTSLYILHIIVTQKINLFLGVRSWDRSDNLQLCSTSPQLVFHLIKHH